MFCLYIGDLKSYCGTPGKRQREVVAKAKAAGKYKGRKPIPDAIRQEVIRLAGERMTKTAIASQLNISATVYRILAAASKQKS